MLFVDEFVHRQGFQTTEEYLVFCDENRSPAWFKGEGYFFTLLENRLTLPGYSNVRTRYTGGADHSYGITENGMLEGLDINFHPGPKGLHDPRIVLSLEKAEYGWEVTPFRTIERPFEIMPLD